MADAAILIGWNEPRAGREAMAAGLFAEATQYYASLVANGTIESFEPVLLSRHGGDFNGFILLRGERARLDALRSSQEFITLVVRAEICLDGFGVIDAYVGAGVQRIMQIWMAALPK